ncbi:pyridoxamine 5'-phosphate oxidase-domain-containing protein [Coprinopsis sp. MPI-PUGE-AT-0042]|nr:pyridoxamine 5'-phosphate oxidase-domain-containing protein [Coprinopsis sp. MPI-PUGE-AT-0042]
MPGSSSSAPRWKSVIESAISQYKKQTGKAHVRSMVFRSFLDPQSHPNLPLLVSSTDVRTPKVIHITSSPEVELAWWIEGTQQQFRLSGRTSIIPSPSQKHLYSHFGNIVKSVNEGAEQSKRAGLLGLEAVTLTPSFDWEQKRLEEPGPRSSEEDRKNWGDGFGNFALVIIEPTYVDFVILGSFPTGDSGLARDEKGNWEELELVP